MHKSHGNKMKHLEHQQLVSNPCSFHTVVVGRWMAIYLQSQDTDPCLLIFLNSEYFPTVRHLAILDP